MPPPRYKTLEVVKGATIHECLRCGGVIFNRKTHNKWHTEKDEIAKDRLLAIKRLQAQIIELQTLDVKRDKPVITNSQELHPL